MTRKKQATASTLARLTRARLTLARLARHAFAAAAVLVISLFATAASACPVCAQRSDSGTLGTVALGVFILMPWCVALVVGWTIRRGVRSAAGATVSSEITP